MPFLGGLFGGGKKKTVEQKIKRAPTVTEQTLKAAEGSQLTYAAWTEDDDKQLLSADFVYEVTFQEGSLGLKPGPLENCESGMCVVAFQPGSQADKAPNLTIGDIILKIGNNDVTREQPKELGKLVKASPRPVKFTFFLQTVDDYTVEFGPGPIGMAFHSDRPGAPCYVRALQPGSLAEQSEAGIEIGDRVVRVGDTDVRRMSEEEIGKVFKSSSRPVRVYLRSPPEKDAADIEFEQEKSLIKAREEPTVPRPKPAKAIKLPTHLTWPAILKADECKVLHKRFDAIRKGSPSNPSPSITIGQFCHQPEFAGKPLYKRFAETILELTGKGYIKAYEEIEVTLKKIVRKKNVMNGITFVPQNEKHVLANVVQSVTPENPETALLKPGDRLHSWHHKTNTLFYPSADLPTKLPLPYSQDEMLKHVGKASRPATLIFRRDHGEPVSLGVGTFAKVNRNDQIELVDFVNMCQVLSARFDVNTKYLVLLKMADVDGDGVISKDDLFHFLKLLLVSQGGSSHVQIQNFVDQMLSLHGDGEAGVDRNYFLQTFKPALMQVLTLYE